MDRGTDSVNNLLNYILFSIVPTIVDIIVAIAFFVVAYNKWFGLIVFLTMSLYIGKYYIFNISVSIIKITEFLLNFNIFVH